MFFDNNFKRLQKYRWNGENMPTPWVTAVGTAGSSVHIAETHQHKLNAGNQEFEANTDYKAKYVYSSDYEKDKLWLTLAEFNSLINHTDILASARIKECLDSPPGWDEAPRALLVNQFIRRPC